VDQATAVCRRQPGGNLATDSHHLGGRQATLALQPGVERFAHQQRHGQEGDASVLAHLVDGDDVVVLDGRCRSRLVQ
jgi:hypothetical protein